MATWRWGYPVAAGDVRPAGEEGLLFKVAGDGTRQTVVARRSDDRSQSRPHRGHIRAAHPADHRRAFDLGDFDGIANSHNGMVRPLGQPDGGSNLHRSKQVMRLDAVFRWSQLRPGRQRPRRSCARAAKPQGERPESYPVEVHRRQLCALEAGLGDPRRDGVCRVCVAGIGWRQ